MPADFVPNASVYGRGEELGFDRARVDREMVKMRDHAEREGRRCVDWHAAARSWLTKAKEIDEQRPTRAHNGSAIPRQPGRWEDGDVEEIS